MLEVFNEREESALKTLRDGIAHHREVVQLQLRHCLVQLQPRWRRLVWQYWTRTTRALRELAVTKHRRCMERAMHKAHTEDTRAVLQAQLTAAGQSAAC